MARWRSTIACAQAAQWLSLELDGELSELERAALAAHLEGCVECSYARAELGALTSLIREAPLEAPRVPIAVLPPRPPRRERRARRAATAAVAVAAVFAAAVALLGGPNGSPDRSSSGLASASPAQRLQFAAAEHARTDPQAPSPNVANLSPYAFRALFGSF